MAESKQSGGKGKQKQGSKDKSDSINPKLNVSPIQRFKLDAGLEVWKVNIEQIIEQDLNARAMSKSAFLQLSENIKKRGAFESLPLCAITDKGLELISGHHRVRAARKAEVQEVWVLVDVTDIGRSNLLSKQLSHNSLQGRSIILSLYPHY